MSHSANLVSRHHFAASHTTTPTEGPINRSIRSHMFDDGVDNNNDAKQFVDATFLGKSISDAADSAHELDTFLSSDIDRPRITMSTWWPQRSANIQFHSEMWSSSWVCTGLSQIPLEILWESFSSEGGKFFNFLLNSSLHSSSQGKMKKMYFSVLNSWMETFSLFFKRQSIPFASKIIAPPNEAHFPSFRTDCCSTGNRISYFIHLSWCSNQI